MSKLKNWLQRLLGPVLTVFAIAFAIVVGGFAFTDFPQKLGLVAASEEAGHEGHDHSEGGHDDHSGHDHGEGVHDDHEGHDHGHEGHDESNSIELSAQARANLKLTTQAVSVGQFNEYIEVPAAVADWPGRTHVAITSPLTGVINAINVSRGELLKSGRPLFTLRLTHQDLVETQEQFLASLGELDVEKREITRLTSLSGTGAIAGKTLLTREYERDKLMANLGAAKQSMLLHGLTESQVQSIEQTRELIREVTIFAPTLHADRSLHHDSLHEASPQWPSANAQSQNRTVSTSAKFASMQPPPTAHPAHIDAEFLVTQLDVSRGESVQAGQKLGQLSDYSQILIEGHAYQRDGLALQEASQSGAELQAVIESRKGKPELIKGLKIVYIGNEVDRVSRALPFYVSLTNEVERSEEIGGQQYVSWRYKPGQRLQVRVPVAGFDNAIVVPKEAVAEEGPERFVFVENNDHFDRVAVEVLASDSLNVAIKNDGQVWPGQSIAVSGAHQLQMALKNKSGGAIDPHAGHNH
ncbi:efflux RND transporter periplasmic adaptor subunit [Rhodopirellula bahusiensis]|uniref:Hemolysin D n=1 Tax=Rhodopirellula bahusiensis TaxID=2014065 RepID=A0A2G1W7Q3_9BACT|nr:efflux RND transporter periplasmic adaptor subunit [Rhodopirellula bahusiensis]PHQ35072.1 hemolysin D [Rhodopirellula bahusiensis]